MPFTAPDINLISSNYDATNLQDYVDVLQHNYLTGKTYILLITGEDNTTIDPLNALGIPSTANITWTLLASKTKTFSAISAFVTTVSSDTLSNTTLNFPTEQSGSAIGLFEFNNASSAITNTAQSSWQALSGSLEIATISQDGMALLFVAPANATVKDFATGAGQTAITGTGGKSLFAQYNLDSTEIMPVTTNQGGHYMAIGLELPFASTALLSIVSVNGGSSIADGQTGVTLAVTNGVVSSNVVTISPTEEINDVNAVAQTITSDGVSSIDITASLPAGSTDQDPVYVFLANGTDTTVGFTVSVTPMAAYLHTLSLKSVDSATTTAGSFVVDTQYQILTAGTTDYTLIGAADSNVGTRFIATGIGAGTGTANKLTPIICQSTDFALGVTAYVNKGLGSEQVASLITEVSNANTSTPQFQCTFATEPTGADTINIDYDSSVGDISSASDNIPLASFSLQGTTC